MTNPPPVDPWQGRQPVPEAAEPMSREPTANLTALAGRWRAWWSRQTTAAKVVIAVVVAMPLVALCAGVTGSITAPERLDDAAGGSPGLSTAPGTPGGRGTLAEAAAPTATIDVRTVTETEEIPFEELIVEDPDLLAGTTQVRVEGRPGVRTLTYEVTYTGGVETDRRLVGEEVTREPVDRVVARGTGRAPEPEPEPAPEPDCHPSYTGACVPFASDVDCEGGSGNGPAYVRGPVRIVGPDEYDLDRDGDGVAREP